MTSNNSFRSQLLVDESPPLSSIVASDRVIFGDQVFGSWEWDLKSQAPLRSHESNYSINWLDQIGEEFCYGDLRSAVISFMEFTFARLKDPVESESAIKVPTARNNLGVMKLVLDWMNEKGFKSFSKLNKYDIGDFSEWQRAKYVDGVLSEGQIAKLQNVLKKYYIYSKRVSDPLGFNPFTSSASELVGANTSSEENKTPVIPFEVMSPLLRYTLNMVNIYCEDILAARDRIFELRDNIVFESLETTPELSTSGLWKRLKKALDRLLPTLLISNDPDTGKPWRKPWKTFGQWQRDERQLFNACMCVTFFLSGMRSSEVELLHVDGVSEDISSDGVSSQYKVRSSRVKHNEKDDAWIVIEPVFKAVNLAVNMAQPLRDELGTELVYFALKNNNKNSFLGPLVFGMEKSIKAESTDKEGICDQHGAGKGTTNYRLSSLISYINTVFNNESEGKLIPDIDGQEWMLSSRQFRRTLARYIARQPFGIIAGMIQYKHANTATFEGYAGNDPDWSRMLEEERVMASVDHLKDLYFDLDQGAVAGVKGKELLDDFEQIFADFKGVAGDRRKSGLDYWLEHTRANLYVGKLNYCFFNPDTAMCSHKDDEKQIHPVLNRCHPDKCVNSCVGTKHLPMWQAQADDANDLLSKKDLSEPQRSVLERDRDDALKIIVKVRHEEKKV